MLDYRTAPGTSLTETDRLLQPGRGDRQREPDVDTYSRRTGTQLGGGLTEPNKGDFFVRLKTRPRRADRDGDGRHPPTGRSARPGPRHRDCAADGRPDRRPHRRAAAGRDQALSLDDPTALANQAARNVADAIGKVHGVVEVHDGIVPAGDALDIRIDPARPRSRASTAERRPGSQASCRRQCRHAGAAGAKTDRRAGLDAAGRRARRIEASSARCAESRARRPPVPAVAHRGRCRSSPASRRSTRDNLQRMIAVTARDRAARPRLDHAPRCRAHGRRGRAAAHGRAVRNRRPLSRSSRVRSAT